MTSDCYTVQALARGVHLIGECGVFCYLVEGNERSLLIDCGTGLGGMEKTVRSITAKPLTVAATHAHPDHIGGCGAFGTYCLHPDDFPIAGHYGSLEMRRRLFSAENAEKFGVTQNDIVAYTLPEPLPMPDRFDLGGKTVSVVHTPGHTRGSVVFTVEEDKLLFTGDNVCRALWMFLKGATSVEAWIPGAKRILDLTETYVPYCGHEPAPQDRKLIAKLIATAERLVAETEKNVPGPRRVYPENYDDHGIVYLPDRVLGKGADT